MTRAVPEACVAPDGRILTSAEMAGADRAAVAAGTPVIELMERAGAAVTEAIAARWSARPTVVLCGPGHNGGDGFVVARRLAERGWPVKVAALPGRGELKGAALEAAGRWAGETVALNLDAIAGAELVVVALFGTGLSRPLDAEVRGLLQACESQAPVVAVDLPAGLAADTGQPLGYAVQATLTVTFHRKKPAHVLEPGRSLCGEIVLADIGLAAPGPAPTWLCENGPQVWLDLLPSPAVSGHKADRGRLVVVSGPAWHTGAARLSVRAGLRIGAGLATLLSPPDALAENAAHLEAVMLRPFDGERELLNLAKGANAAVIGPGAGMTPRTRLNVRTLAETGAPLVLDADVFTVFRDAPERLFALLGPKDVLTPHPGEFGRVFPGLLDAGPERITAARAAAVRSGAVVLLKGSDTVVAAPDGRAVVNTNAAPWLATAGSGDVLAGFIAGLIAQGMPSFEAAAAGVWIHAEAGRIFGPGLISEDLPGRAPAVLSRLFERKAAGRLGQGH